MGGAGEREMGHEEGGEGRGGTTGAGAGGGIRMKPGKPDEMRRKPDEMRPKLDEMRAMEALVQDNSR
jgi:hypothetical protein